MVIATSVAPKANIQGTNASPLASKNKSELAAQLNSVNLSGTESILPKNAIKNTINISGDVKALHASNHEKQIDNVLEIVSQGNSAISREMVKNVMGAGGHGNSIQQELNQRPEVSLVILTLLAPHEITPKLISNAQTLIKKMSVKCDSTDNKEIKQVLDEAQKKLDQQVESTLSTMGDNALDTLAIRYQEKYVNPAIKQQLGEYFDSNTIDSRPIDNFLVNDLNQQQTTLIESTKKEYANYKNAQFGDKYQHLNNMFRHIEQKIEIISPLKIKMDLNETAKPDSAPSASPLLAAQPSGADEVDGRRSGVPTGSQPSSSSSVKDSYNTTIINNNYYGSQDLTSSVSKNISAVKNSDLEVNKDGLPSHASTVNLTSSASAQVDVANEQVKQNESTSSEPDIDYTDLSDELGGQKNIKEQQSVDTVDGRASPVKSEDVTQERMAAFTRWTEAAEPEKVAEPLINKTQVFIPMTHQTPVAQMAEAVVIAEAAAESVPNDETTMMDSSSKAPPSKDVELDKPTNLIANGYQKVVKLDESTGKSKITWELANPTVVKPVTLTESGALTRNQAEKNNYLSDNKVNITSKNEMFANRYQAVTDETSGKSKKTWQLTNEKSPRVVLTTEGALTRDLTVKNRYTNAKEAETKTESVIRSRASQPTKTSLDQENPFREEFMRTNK